MVVDESRWSLMMSALAAGPPKEEKRERPIIYFHTPWQHPADGWSIAARNHAKAMERGGLDVRLASWKDDGSELHPEVAAECGHMGPVPLSWDLHVFSSTLAGAAWMAEPLKALRMQEGPQWYHAVFERQYIEPALVSMLNKLDRVWVQCSANRDVLVDHGVTNTILLYHPWFEDDPHLEIPPAAGPSRRFYWIGRFEPRKSPDNLIRAFFRAFKPADDVRLTMKLSPVGHAAPYATPEEVAHEEAKRCGWPRSVAEGAVVLLRGHYSKEEMREVHAANDTYVSASRGEGCDLPAFAAKLSGRRLVMTDSGGPRDFVTSGDIIVPQRGTIPSDIFYQWGDGACYADYSVEELAAAFVEASRTAGDGLRVPDKLSALNVGAAWKEAVCAL